ncbi:MAG: hypothetical protein JNJ57_08195 [Saprospiraceae bacterium]|nr:hypothetical protein [Saprospiraceae bacterium]
MKQNLFLLYTVAVMASCSDQAASRQGAPPAAGPINDTLNQLSRNIMTIYQDQQNNYWFASWEDGLYKYDGKTILHFTTKNGLPSNRVEDVQEDKSGNIFFNTPGGVCKVEGQTIRVLPAKESAEWQLHADDLWFRSLQYNGKIYRYDGSELHHLQLPTCPPGEAWVAKYPTNPSPYGTYTIYKDSKGNLWFGTAAVGACRYNGRSFDWISEEDVTELHNGPSNGVRSIIEDKDGYFWFKSAYRYQVYGNNEAQKEPFYRREKSIGNLDGNPFSDFWEYLSIARADNNDLWFATYRNGVWRYDGKKTTAYPVQAEGKGITLFSIYKDKQGNLWLGTHENGVYKLNGNKFERFRL